MNVSLTILSRWASQIVIMMDDIFAYSVNSMEALRMASNGHRGYLKAICEDIHTFPTHLLPKVVDPILSAIRDVDSLAVHLRATTDRLLESDAPILLGALRFAGRVPGSIFAHPDLCLSIVEAWRVAATWFEVVASGVIKGLPQSQSSAMDRLAFLETTLSSFFQFGFARKRIQESVQELVMDLWLRPYEGASEVDTVARMLCDSHRVDSELDRKLDRDPGVFRLKLEERARKLGLTTSAAVDLALRRLEVSFRATTQTWDIIDGSPTEGSDSNIDHCSKHMRVLLMLTYTHDSPTVIESNITFERLGGVVKVIAMLTSALEWRKVQERNRFDEFFTIGVGVLTVALHYCTSLDCVKQAIKTGLLECLVKIDMFGDTLDPIGTKSLNLLMRVILPSFMLFSSVVSMGARVQDLLHSRHRSEPRGHIKREFLFDIFEHRFSAYTHFKLNTTMATTCCNVGRTNSSIYIF